MNEQIAPKLSETVYSFTAAQLSRLAKTAVRPFMDQAADASIEYLKELLGRGVSADKVMPLLIAVYQRYGPQAVGALGGGRMRIAGPIG